MRALLLAPLLLAGCVAAAPPAASAAPWLTYAVRFEGSALHVRVEGDLPAGRWSAVSGRRVIHVEADDGVRRIEDGEVTLPAGLRRLSYRFELGDEDLLGGVRAPAGCVVGSDRYLLLPDADARIAVTAVDGLFPWTPGERLAPAALRRPRFHAFGGRRRTVEVRGGVVEVALLDAFGASDDDLAAWVRQAAEEVSTVRAGELPLSPVTITVLPSFGREGASPFGMQSWGTVAVLVNVAADRDDLRQDWVLVHELMHLAAPTFEEGAHWLTEGVATYLSVLGRLRSGRMTEAEAWWEVLDGATAGRRRAGEAGLLELNRALHMVHAYRSVYWGGALFALDLDLTIREVTRGARDLCGLLESLRAGPGPVTLERLRQATDALTGARTFDAVLARHTEGPALASAERLLGELGVTSRPDGRGVALRDEPRRAAIGRPATPAGG